MDVNPDQHSQLIVSMFFDLSKRDAEEKVFCRMVVWRWALGVFATWVRDDGSVVKRLIACGVQDLPETNDAAASFGFTADDIGDYIFDALASYGHDFSSVEFLTGDNAYINGALCTKIEAWIYRNKGIRRSVPLVGCASHKLNLAVQFLCSEKSNLVCSNFTSPYFDGQPEISQKPCQTRSRYIVKPPAPQWYEMAVYVFDAQEVLKIGPRNW